MTLRLRLILAFLAVVSLLLLVGAMSFFINSRIQTEVADLRASRGLDLRRVHLDSVSLEIEGFWDQRGSFVATEVEVLPGKRPPKLRGEIQSIDEVQHTVTLYGVPIRVVESTEFVDGGATAIGFSELRPGQRIEASCSVVDGHWTAHRIKTRNVKASDKIKGTVTSAELDGKAPESVEYHGLLVSLEAPRGDSPKSALRRIELATRMTLALQDCRSAAHELAGRTFVGRDPGGTRELDLDTDPSMEADERLVRGVQEFEYYLEQSHVDDADIAGSSLPSAFAPRLRSLTHEHPVLRKHMATLQGLARADADRARAFLDDVFDPFLQNDLLPLVHAYLTDAEEALADRVQALSSRAHTTTRVALATSAVAVIVAIVLGSLVWRSIQRPVGALHAAALRLGQGHLDTRVAICSRDEFGVLADAFNKMAGALAITTVSLSNLESVFDSMAGALFILDSQGRITSVNGAALQLLGYEREDLIGQPFDTICPTPTPRRDPAPPMVRATDDGILVIEEKVFLKKDGGQIPVSFSGAELRASQGPLHRYVCVAQDLTDRKRIEEQISRSLAEKELLLREVHHRVKNNMQIVSSLLAIQSSYITDPRTIEVFEESQHRIRSMALIHEQLYRTSDFTALDLRAYFELLTSHLLQSFGHSGSPHLELDVEDLAIDVDQALACGLIVNELVTNALKHAFPGSGGGEIHVSLSQDEAGNRLLSVSDNGRGVAEDIDLQSPNAVGFTLVMTLVQQLQGRLTVAGATGTEVRIVFPPKRSEEVAAA